VKEYVLDANAVMRYLRLGDGAGGDRVEALIEQARRGYTTLVMSAVNFGEVFYVGRRFLDEASLMARLDAVQQAITIIPADAAHAVEAARLKHRHKLSSADCFAAALAMGRGATLVSADPSFEQCGHALKWMRLSPYRG
jgi:predicted nucleic acid-binding protein